MKMLMEHLIEENGYHRKFGCLDDMRRNYPCQLGALTSETYSEKMISAANLLVDSHRILLRHDNVDKMVVF